MSARTRRHHAARMPRAEEMDPRLHEGGLGLFALVSAAAELDPAGAAAAIEEIKTSWSDDIQNGFALEQATSDVEAQAALRAIMLDAATSPLTFKEQ